MRGEQDQSLFIDRMDKGKVTIKEIVIRHQVSRQGMAVMDKKENNSTTVGCFKVQDPPNPYATDEITGADQEKYLQVKILDVVYNNQICSLVYLHDITSVISDKQKLSSWGITLVKEPDKFMHDLTEQIYSVYGGEAGLETENALSDFR